ncbi:MAG: AAA family ATPase [Pseudomonadota bacterium]|nr:AAA family ATPase [Pseudomonadota bacterium]
MYLEYFGLNAKPFQLTPDPEFIYLSPGHARAKAYMDYSIWNRDSFVVITGDIGSGKTTLIQLLLTEIDDRVIVARIHQTQLNEIEFFQAVLVAFGFKPFDAGKVELLDMLNTFLIEQYQANRQVVLIVDEAQNLSPRVLEEVRLMTGLETHKEKLLNLILAGQPELRELLDAPGMEQLNQRIRFRFHLEALNEEETREYINHRLDVAGNTRAELIPESVIPLIHRYSGGVPRLINSLCDTALIAAFVDENADITEKTIEDAIQELQWSPYSERGHGMANSLPDAMRGTDHGGKRLEVEKRAGVKQDVSLDKDTITLGRLPGNDVMIEDTVVSGHHAKIMIVHGTAFLEDLNSTNGTFVNSERVRKCVLKHGDVISLARCRILYIDEAVASQEAGDSRPGKTQVAPVDDGSAGGPDPE